MPAVMETACWTAVSEEMLLDAFMRTACVVRCGWCFDTYRDASAEERRENVPLYHMIFAEVSRRAQQWDASEAMRVAYLCNVNRSLPEV